MANSLIEEIRAKHGGTEEEAVQEELAKCVTGIAYGGKPHSAVTSYERPDPALSFPSWG